MIRAFAILLFFQFAGNLFVGLFSVMIPGNVLGMLMLTVLLGCGWLRVESVEPAAMLLTDNLAFLFVPAGVGIMSYFGVLAAEWLPISLSVVVSLVAVLVVTGKLCDVFVAVPGNQEGDDD
jgi:holin-like protein